jgi:hypothetical protein
MMTLADSLKEQMGTHKTASNKATEPSLAAALLRQHRNFEMPKKPEIKQDSTELRSKANTYKRDRSGSNNAKRPPIPEQKEYFNKQTGFSSTIDSNARNEEAPGSSIIAEMHYQRGMKDIKQDL